MEDGRLIGRGAADMKGPIASALAAAAAIRRAGIELAGTLTFHLAADEEHMGMYGTKVLWDRGMLDQDACVVGEPSDLQVGLAERGGAWITATARGKAATARSRNLGVNAITSMARLLLRLPEVAPRSRASARRPAERQRRGDHRGSAPNVVPDRCEWSIDRRIIPGETDPAEVLAPFERSRGRHRTRAPRGRPVVRDRRMDRRGGGRGGLRDRRRSTRCGRGASAATRPADVGFTGITDARFYINDAEIPTIILGPGSLGWRIRRTNGCWSMTWSRPRASTRGSSSGSWAPKPGRQAPWNVSTSS